MVMAPNERETNVSVTSVDDHWRRLELKGICVRPSAIMFKSDLGAWLGWFVRRLRMVWSCAFKGGGMLRV